MRLLAILGLMAASAGAAATAQTAAPLDEARTVDFELSEDGEVVAAPSLRMQPGRTAAVSVGAYSLRLRMDRGPAAEGAPAPYLIRSSIYRSEGGSTLVASPSVTVVQGETTRLRIAGNDGRDLSLAVLVR